MDNKEEIEKKYDWLGYYSSTKNQPPRHLLTKALDLFFKNKTGIALDLGAGAGRDTIYLLKQGWSVWAVDREETAIKTILRETPLNLQEKLTCYNTDFLDMELDFRFDLCSAQLSLMFLPPSQIQSVIDKIYTKVKVNGVFVASFLGYQDDLVKNKNIPGSDLEKLRQYFSKFQVIELEEEIKNSQNSLSAHNQSHFLKIIARK